MAKKIGKTQKMVMKDEDIRYRERLLERWGFVCIVCGRGFANLACVTREHIVPRSLEDGCGFRVYDDMRVAPSHYQCNQLRGAKSFIQAARLVDEQERMRGPKGFLAWLNKVVPNRIVPPHAMQPVLGRPRVAFELPEWLPGMS